MRALLFGFTAGVLLSALRAPLGLDLLSIPASSAAASYGYRAAALGVVALGLFAAGGALDGRRRLGSLVGGTAAGLATHALFSGRTPTTPAGALALALVGLGILLFCGRFLAAGRRAPAERPGGPGLAGEATALAIAGAGLALVLEGLARHVRLLGPGLPAEHGLLAAVLLGLVLLGGLAFGRLVPSGSALVPGRAAALSLAALGGLVGLFVVQGLATPAGLDEYLRRFGLDTSRAGMADGTALVGGAAFVVLGLALGAALFTLEARRQLAALLLGGAVGLALVPRLLAARAVDDPQLFLTAMRTASSAGLVRDGMLVALLGAALSAACASRAGWGARGVALVFAGLAALPLAWIRIDPLAITRPWRERALAPLFSVETAEGLLAIDRSDGGLEMLTLDGRELTPPTVRGALDRRCIELAVALLPAERRARGELAVLLIGQLTPGRALALTGLGATTVDRSASWHRAMPLLEERLFHGGALPAGRVLSPAAARGAMLSGTYDLVLVPAVPGEAPSTSNLASAPGTLTVVWLDGASDVASRALGEVLVTTDLEHLALAVARGGARGAEAAEFGQPAFLPAGARRSPVRPLIWLGLLRHERDSFGRRRLCARLARASGEGTPSTQALAAHFGTQRHSSPFETRAQRVEVEPRTLEWIRAAALAPVPSSLDRDLAEGLAAVLAGKRWADELRVYLTEPADRHWPWVGLERALAYAHLEALEPGPAAERLERLVEVEASDVEVWALLGEALLQVGRPADASAAFSRALDLAPGVYELERRLAMALVRAGDPLGRELALHLLVEEPGDDELRLYAQEGPLPPVRLGYRPSYGASTSHEHGSDHDHPH